MASETGYVHLFSACNVMIKYFSYCNKRYSEKIL